MFWTVLERREDIQPSTLDEHTQHTQHTAYFYQILLFLVWQKISRSERCNNASAHFLDHRIPFWTHRALWFQPRCNSPNRALRVLDRLSSTGFMILSIPWYTYKAHALLMYRGATVYFWPDFSFLLGFHKSVRFYCAIQLAFDTSIRGPIWECCFAGGALALQAALSFPHTLAGVCSVAGWASAGIHPAQLKDMPILMCHGYDDSMVPIQVARSSCIGLRCPVSALEWQSRGFRMDLNDGILI